MRTQFSERTYEGNRLHMRENHRLGNGFNSKIDLKELVCIM
jgi:hypothetical protein